MGAGWFRPTALMLHLAEGKGPGEAETGTDRSPRRSLRPQGGYVKKHDPLRLRRGDSLSDAIALKRRPAINRIGHRRAQRGDDEADGGVRTGGSWVRPLRSWARDWTRRVQLGQKLGQTTIGLDTTAMIAYC